MSNKRQKLIEELNRLSDNNGGKVTCQIMDESGEFSASMYRHHFGSWNDALKEAGIAINEKKNVSESELICEIERVSKEFCCGRTPTKRDIKKHSKYSDDIFCRKFGSWNNALKESGFDINIEQNASIKKKDLINEIKYIKEKYSSGSPKKKDIEEHSKYSIKPFYTHFGSWREAVKCAGFEPNLVHPSGEEHPLWRGGNRNYYGPSWTKQRQKALERDNYSCVICGEEKKEGRKNIHVHHIVPKYFWDVDNEHKTMNILDNLVCLCRQHHKDVEGKHKKFTYSSFIEEVVENV